MHESSKAVHKRLGIFMLGENQYAEANRTGVWLRKLLKIYSARYARRGSVARTNEKEKAR